MTKFMIDGREYETESLSKHGQKIVVELTTIHERMQETQNLIAILNRARKAYIADLKSEMLSAKAGLDFSGE